MSFKKISIVTSFTIFLLYGIFISALFYFYKSSLFIETLLSPRTLFSVRLSITAASVATVLSILIGIPTAYALSRFSFKGKNIIDTILELPMIVSPAALGAMILIFFNTPVGRFVQEKTFQFVFAFAGIVLAQFITTAGIATRLIKATLDEIPQRYEDVARSLGATHLRAFLTVTLPMAKRGIIASIILTWAKALGEFGATITVAGSMAMKTETLPIAIFMRLASADVEGAVVLIVILIVIGLGILYIVRLLTNRRSFL